MSAGSRPPKPWLQQRAEQVGVGEVGLDRLADARVLHLDGDGPLDAGRRVDDDGAVDLADRRRGDRLGIPLDEQLAGGAPELALDDLGGELRRHRRRRRLQLRRAPAHRLGQALVEVARHLAELHQRALHVARAARRLLGGAQLAPPGRARRGARRRRTPCGRSSTRTSCRPRTPRRARSRLRPDRGGAVDRPGAAGPTAGDARRRPPRRFAGAATIGRRVRRYSGVATCGIVGQVERPSASTRHASSSTGTTRSGLATTAS